MHWENYLTSVYFLTNVVWFSQDLFGEDFKSQGSHVAYTGQDFATQVCNLLINKCFTWRAWCWDIINLLT